MTTATEPRERRRLGLILLPWLVAAGALAVYFWTLNPWVSVLNLGTAAKLNNWVWTPEVVHPAWFVVTYPLHWLPKAWLPFGLNALSGVLAALTLAQLARIVLLLPHDRTHEQRERVGNEAGLLRLPLAWLPPVLAVLACGLQLTFWEHATNGTTEMLDLLILAYVVRSLLEFRQDQKTPRLYRTSLVYAIGITNNLAMIAFFPLFLVALIWIRGLKFFNAQFLLRMFLFGLAGLSLYLLLPLIASHSEYVDYGFWAALKHYLAWQRDVVFLFPRKCLLVLSLTTLLPILVLSIRWSSYFGDSSFIGQAVATSMVHVVHAVLLFGTVWVMFDPPFSPRVKGVADGLRHLGLQLEFLSLYFMAAISIGYFSGYFLLVFRRIAERGKRPTPAADFLNKLGVGVAVLLLVLVPAGLLQRNLPEIRMTNGPLLRNYATLLTHGLPNQGVLFSDESFRSFVLSTRLQEENRLRNYLLLDTQSLNQPGYHRYLHDRFPERWPAPHANRKSLFDDGQLMQLAVELGKTNDVYYLQPSFGYYFELFYPRAHGLVYQLKAYEKGQVLPPAPAAEDLKENESFWEEACTTGLRLIISRNTAERNREPDLLDKVFQSLQLPRRKNETVRFIGRICARPLNHWAVELQRANQLEKAAARFQNALELNPDNVVAKINLDYNAQLRAGNPKTHETISSVEDKFGAARSWDQVLNFNGPYDEPALCLAQGLKFVQAGLYRQAAQAFDRVRTFLDSDLTSRLYLAQIHLTAKNPDQTLALVNEVKSASDRFGLGDTDQLALMALEAPAWLAKGNVSNAEHLIEHAIETQSTNDAAFDTAVAVYIQHGLYTNALDLVERHLKFSPENSSAMFSKGYVSMQLGREADAITAFTALLERQTNAAALLNRAIAFMRTDQLDAAKADYEALLRENPTAHQIYYGLGEIAWRRHETNTAIRHYENYLSNAPPSLVEYTEISSRLRQLMGAPEQRSSH